ISVQRLPAIAVEGLAQYQSDVPTAPFTLPSGQPLFSPPKATFDGHLRIDQRLFDPSVSAQAALERAQLDESQARVRTALYARRQMVNDAFFAAALLQQHAATLTAAVGDLAARLRETEARVREGAALPSDAAAVEATLLLRQQDEAALRSDRKAALARLSKLTAQSIGEDDVLVLPETAAAVADARLAPDEQRGRPEYTQFSRSRERIARQQDASSAQDLPRVSAFARVGYGRPGLNFISDQFETYGLGGVQLQWKAWTWGAGGRDREALAIQQQIVDADQASFARTLSETIEMDLATIDRLGDTLATDDRIVALRESIDRSTKARLDEGVVTAAEYLDRSAELLQARYNRTGHQVELAQASARFLTTLGVEVR
ncbi:MAG TPA: TolC family protein, partial [Vicinamibacterales bacterium]|nr:TolC family protein [Vicinamibacterales bacterium]